MADPILMCAVCRRPLARWFAIDDPRQMGRTFEAHCHGEVDVCTLGLADVRALSDAIRHGRPVEAVAFGGRALPAPASVLREVLAIVEGRDGR